MKGDNNPQYNEAYLAKMKAWQERRNMGDNESQIKNSDKMRRFILDAIDRAKQCCVNCVHFTEANIYCNLHKGQPPVRVVTFGCDKFMPTDDIPY